MEKPTILVLEDERDTADNLCRFLDMKGFSTLKAYDGKSALALLESHSDSIQLAVLDVMVPGIDGYQICGHIKKNPKTSGIPVIFLTAKDREEDEISGLQLGADDYITKPAGLQLILTRIQVLLKRFPRFATESISFAGISIHLDRREIICDGKLVEATPTEFELLALFFKNPKRVYSRQEILDLVYKQDKLVFDRTVDVHIKNLRIKLEPNQEIIRTVRGIGYGLNREKAGLV